ncbi:uncharacterized protein LOC121654014 isoform X2 [Melanotaenia boesemani]|uniref:uncharacterized protein LOC121654014 isoform X2 n=1 Tax=Melanotaenia boesemani TaxID=1250792 RepID=UPI001C050B1C|nr:uncharacterized protein LOC121654014 isoform X2 [Melanotaenia boesemani]
MDKACLYTIIPLALALLVSFCVNIFLCIKRRTTISKDIDERHSPHSSEGENLSQNERHYFHDLNHQEQQENPHNHDEQQENPIYGNIMTDKSDPCYEMMTTRRARQYVKPSEPDLNYASLDLKIAKKRKKLRHLQGQSQGRHKLQDQLPDHLSPAAYAFSEVDADMEAHLPPRDTGIMISHSSIYLNSQQIAQETEEMERERSVNMEKENADWDSKGEGKKGGGREWEGDEESEDRMDKHGGSNGNVFAQLSEVETTQNCSDDISNSFNSNSN